MRNLFLVSIALICSSFSNTKVKSDVIEKVVESTSAELFFSKLLEQSNTVFSITSHFTQTKYLKLLDTKLLSEGTFYYKKKSKIRFDYTIPKVMSILMVPEKLSITANDKITTYDLSSQKSLSDLAAVMEACISGNIKLLPKNYKADYELDVKSHIIRIRQLTKSVKSPYSLIELRLNLRDYSLEQLTLFENSEDYTIYSFTKISVNQELNPSLFAI